MTQSLLIAPIAGLISALMFASVATGLMLSGFVVFLAPLPVMVATLGWGSAVGIAAALLGAAALGALLGPLAFVAFLTAIGLPAWWLGHLTMLAQPPAPGQQDAQWYPAGRILAWIAAIVIAGSAVSMLFNAGDAFGTDEAARQELARMLEASGRVPQGADLVQFVEMLLRILPAITSFFAVIVLALDLWAAGHVVRLMGRLRRPWPDLSMMALPAPLLAVLGVAIVLMFAGEPVATYARVAVAGLVAAFLLLGLAVFHNMTTPLTGRPFWLGALYVALLFGWPVLPVVVLGLVEQLFGLRAQFARRLPPPPPTQ